jgi:hypothetical protein
VGFCGIFKHFSGFEFFLLPGIAYQRQLASSLQNKFSKSFRYWYKINTAMKHFGQ